MTESDLNVTIAQAIHDDPERKTTINIHLDRLAQQLSLKITLSKRISLYLILLRDISNQFIIFKDRIDITRTMMGTVTFNKIKTYPCQ